MKNSVLQMTDLREHDEFTLILDILMKDREFRCCFFDDPKRALKEVSINLSEFEINELVNHVWAKVSETDTNFDERLLLCCSIGY